MDRARDVHAYCGLAARAWRYKQGCISRAATLSYGRAVMLGLLLTSLFYLNYITLVFGIATGAAMLYRYGLLRAWRQYLATLAVFALLIVPQLHAFFTVHLPGSGGQRTGLLLSLVRLAVALFCSEAYLPWHPLAATAALVFLAILAAGAVQAVRRARRRGTESRLWATMPTHNQGLASLLVFLLVFFFLVVAGGFGIKPRNGLLVVPLLGHPLRAHCGFLPLPSPAGAYPALFCCVGWCRH